MRKYHGNRAIPVIKQLSHLRSWPILRHVTGRRDKWRPWRSAAVAAERTACSSKFIRIPNVRSPTVPNPLYSDQSPMLMDGLRVIAAAVGRQIEPISRVARAQLSRNEDHLY